MPLGSFGPKKKKKEEEEDKFAFALTPLESQHTYM